MQMLLTIQNVRICVRTTSHEIWRCNHQNWKAPGTPATAFRVADTLERIDTDVVTNVFSGVNWSQVRAVVTMRFLTGCKKNQQSEKFHFFNVRRQIDGDAEDNSVRR